MLLRVFTRRVRTLPGPLFLIQRQKAPSFTLRSITMGHPNVVFADPQAAPRSSNKHVSVNPEGIELIDLEFVEEPLGVTAEQGHGFIRVEFGDAIGPDKRYKIVRKLGWGMNSSIWMAFDAKCVLHEIRTHVIFMTSAGKRDTSRSRL